MSQSYQDQQTALAYDAFTNSENGKLQQEIIFGALQKYLPQGSEASMLDAGCGSGWLAGKLKNRFPKTSGFDFSEPLVSLAKTRYPGIEFSVQDLNKKLALEGESFDCVITNMVLHDVADLGNAFSEIARILKPGGNCIATIANPYYAYPVGVWKRGILGFLLRKKPQLKLRPYNNLRSQPRKFSWNNTFTAYFYPLSEYFQGALRNNLSVAGYEDLYAPSDSKTFNLSYQLHRFPTMLTLVFKKLPK